MDVAEASSSSINDWNYVPDVVLDKVLSYLPWKDTINASSTCKRWRSGLYHPQFWKSLTFTLIDFDRDKEAKARYFVNAFGKTVQYVRIAFNTSDTASMSTTNDILQILQHDSRLKRLQLTPTHCVLDSLKDASSSILNANQMYCHILSILTNNDNFEELSIGCLNDVAMYSNRILRVIAEHHSKSIRVLGLASLKYDPDEFILDSLDYRYLENFTNLQILSVNYDFVNDSFLQILRNCVSLKRIVIHVHNSNENHPGTSEEAWIQLTKFCPKVELRLNIIHAPYAVLDLHKSILKRNMPLTHLRVFFCEKLNTEALNSLHMYHNTLKSLWWVDSPAYSNNEILLKTNGTFNVANMNPLIFVAWRCIYLEELVLLGYQYFADDLRAISRLRGTVLKQIHVLRSEMIESDHTEYEHVTSKQIEREVSNLMGKSWKPLAKREVHPVLFHPRKYNSDEYLLPILCKDVE